MFNVIKEDVNFIFQQQRQKYYLMMISFLMFCHLSDDNICSK